MIRWLLVALLFVTLAGSPALVSAQAPGRPGGTFTMAVATAPPTLDWHTSTARAVPVYVGMYVWEGLTALDENLLAQPMLADRWEVSADRLTWTFHLRRGVRFHNGKEMDSADVLASLNRWRQVSPRADALSRVRQITAPDRFTVRFTLSGPLAPLPLILAQEGASPVIHPREVIENVAAGRLTSYVGTGPYRLAQWVPDQQVVLERFPNYSARTDTKLGLAGRKVAYFDRIIFKSVPEAEVRLAGLRTGEFDAAAPLPQEYLAQVQRMEGANPVIVKFDMKPVTFFSFADNSILKSVAMRKAVRAAFDMDEIMFAATGSKDFYELNHDIFFRFQALWSDVGKEVYNQNNPRLARQLARDAGYKGEPIRFVASATQFHHRRPAIMITEQLTAAGFNVHLDLRDWATVSRLQSDPTKWDMIYTRTVLYFPAEVDIIMNMGFDSPEMQKILDVVYRETDLARLRPAFDTFRREVLMEQIPWQLYGDMFALRGERAWIRNLQPIYTHPLWNVWFEGK